MVITCLFDKEFEMSSCYRLILPYQRAQAANCNDIIAPVCFAGPRDIQKHTGLDATISRAPLGTLITYQFMVRSVHELGSFFSLLSATDNDLSFLRDNNRFLEFCSSAIQVRSMDAINRVTGFDEAVETFVYIS